MKTRNLNWMLCFSFVAFLAIQFGCVAGNTPNPSFAYKVPSIKGQLTAEEQKRIKDKELSEAEALTDHERKAYTLFEQLYQKSPLLATELGKIPEFQDGVSPSEIEALEKIVNLIEDINFPADFGERERGSGSGFGQNIFISWGYNVEEKSDWSGHFSLGYQGSKRGTAVLLNAAPYGFESEDKISGSLHLSNMDRRFVSWKSDAGAGDIDGIIATIKAKKDTELTLLLNSEFTTFSIANLSSKDLSLYDGQAKIRLEESTVSETYSQVNALEDMVLAGIGKKYSALLQALLWGYMDDMFDEGANPLQNYWGPVDFVASIWGNMQGPRWKSFNEVTDRLSNPRLLDYYERFNFRYGWGCSGVGLTIEKGLFVCNPSGIFYDKEGNCGAYTTFTTYALRKAGYKAGAVRLEGPSYYYGFHYLTAYIDKGKIFIMDNGRGGGPAGISGPFDSLEQIPHPRTNRIYMGMP